MRDPDVGLFTMLARAMRRRCPRCGGTDIFRTFGDLREHCPSCGFRFEREPGYWAGALIINMAITLLVLFAVLLGGLAVMWPDVEYPLLWVATGAAALLTPILFYPRSKTLWMATELSYHPLEESERAEAAARAADG